jgi:diguanylate cyclase (GGDEF)-like protein
MSQSIRQHQRALVPYGALWHNIYFGRAVMLATLAAVSAVSGGWAAALVVTTMVLPFNQVTWWFHRRTGRAHPLMPLDQLLAALCLVVDARVGVAAAMCQIISAFIAALDRPIDHIRIAVGGAGAMSVAAAIIHDEPSLALYGVPAAITALAGAQVIDSVLRRYVNAESRTEAILNGVNAAIYETDLSTGRLLYSNNLAAALLGDDELDVDRLRRAIHGDDVEGVVRQLDSAAAGRATITVEFRLLAGDHYRWFQQHTVFSQQGDSVRMRAVLVDISERKEFEQQLEFRSLHDPLTGLPNRALMTDRLERALATMVQGKNNEVAVMVLDLDRFKAINDGIGHHAGDALLVALARRAGLELGVADTVARLGGDEFVVVLSDTSAAEANEIAKRIAAAIAEPIDLEGTTLACSVSIGLSMAPEHGVDVVTMLRRADAAMYRAKRSGGGVAMYDAVLDAASQVLASDVAELHAAFAKGEIEAYFQPLIESKTGEIYGAEALVRWEHPTRGRLSPAAFLPALVAAGLSSELARFMLHKAIDLSARQYAQGREFCVAVNLAISDLHQESLVEWLLGELRATGLPPQLLTIEITEAELLSDPNRTRAVLQRLRKLDIEVSVDDFGTGYSSLTWLRELPISALKIDRSFVDAMTVDKRARAIVHSTIGLAQELSLNIVGEGVENVETKSALTELGCHHLQGFLFSEPVSATALTAMVNSQHVASTSLGR